MARRILGVLAVSALFILACTGGGGGKRSKAAKVKPLTWEEKAELVAPAACIQEVVDSVADFTVLALHSKAGKNGFATSCHTEVNAGVASVYYDISWSGLLGSSNKTQVGWSFMEEGPIGAVVTYDSSSFSPTDSGVRILSSKFKGSVWPMIEELLKADDAQLKAAEFPPMVFR